jgi:hypothetical protein
MLYDVLLFLKFETKKGSLETLWLALQVGRWPFLVGDKNPTVLNFTDIFIFKKLNTFRELYFSNYPSVPNLYVRH